MDMAAVFQDLSHALYEYYLLLKLTYNFLVNIEIKIMALPNNSYLRLDGNMSCILRYSR
jgi:hypothetical protein